MPTPPTPDLRVRTLRDLLDAAFPVRAFLLEPVLRQREAMLLWAQTGAGKTMLSLTLALAVAGGGSFLGWRNETPRPVLYVDGEMAIDDLQDRLRTLAGAVEGIDMEAAGANLALLARQDQDRGSTFPDIASEEGQDAVVWYAQDHGADLVICDNFSTLATLEDENDASAMNPVLAFLLRLKADGFACVLVHHSGKSGNSYRGSSKLGATFDAIAGLTVKEGAGGVAGAAFTLEWQKYRRGPQPSLLARDVVLKETEAGGVMWDAAPARKDTIGEVLRAIESGQYASQKEVAEALGKSEARVSEAIASAKATGRITDRRLKETFAEVEAGRRAEGHKGKRRTGNLTEDRMDF